MLYIWPLVPSGEHSKVPILYRPSYDWFYILLFFSEPSDDWGNDDWGWKDDEDQTPESKDEDDSDTSSSGNGECNSWLQQCLVALSPADDLMAIANGYKLVLLASELWSDAKVNWLLNVFKLTPV